MAARKRKSTEDFKQYRTNLKEEAAAIAGYLEGNLVWPGRWGTAIRNTKGVLVRDPKE